MSELRRLEAGCELAFESECPTPLVLMLRPRSGAAQWVVSQRFDLRPAVPTAEFTDCQQNFCQRLVMPAGRLEISAVSTVDVSPGIDVEPGSPRTPPELLPETVLSFLLPSRYCESDRLGDLAAEITQGRASGYDEVEAIRAWIHANIEYRYGVSNASTSAMDTVRDRAGVCRDFTHLGMALCRALTIPARMVVGYLEGLKPMDQHAWFEGFVNDRWYTFDATQDEPLGGRITLGYGRDAADVAFATQFGPATLERFHVWVRRV
jgi:transglutaminase-like putative cysteine protease